MLLGNALCFVSFEDARRALETAVCLAEEVGDLDTLLWALNCLTEVHGALGEPDTQRAYAARMLEIAERVDDPHLIASAKGRLTEVFFTLGEWPKAREHATRYAETLRTLSSSFMLGVPEVFLAKIGVAEGDWDLAANYLDGAITAEHIGRPEFLWDALRIRAELDLLQGRAADALARLQPLLTSTQCAEAQWTAHLAALAETYLELGDSERARAVLDEGLALARAMQNRQDRLAMRRVEGMLLAHQGQWEEAAEAFRDAVSRARSGSNPYAEARALYEWGRMLEVAGKPAQARELHAEALTIFQKLGARPYVERTEQALQLLVCAR
jgi:tetratricopeptide (TPR) repeat protein